jgi:hypothetical protein
MRLGRWQSGLGHYDASPFDPTTATTEQALTKVACNS